MRPSILTARQNLNKTGCNVLTLDFTKNWLKICNTAFIAQKNWIENAAADRDEIRLWRQRPTCRTASACLLMRRRPVWDTSCHQHTRHTHSPPATRIHLEAAEKIRGEAAAFSWKQVSGWDENSLFPRLHRPGWQTDGYWRDPMNFLKADRHAQR